MHNPSSLVTLIEAGRSSDAAELLCDVGHPVSATGERSNWAALEAATRIFASDLLSTIFFMNKVPSVAGWPNTSRTCGAIGRRTWFRDRYDQCNRGRGLHLMGTLSAGSEGANRDSACLHAFGNIAEHWDLTVPEQCKLLGVDQAGVLHDWMVQAQAGDDVSLPEDVMEGIGCVLSIYASLVILLNHDRSKGWVRAPNRAPLFGGRPAMTLMASGNRKDLEDVARYLLSERYR